MVPILCVLTIIWQESHPIPLDKLTGRISYSDFEYQPHHIIVADIVPAILQKLDFMVLSFCKQDNSQLPQTICTYYSGLSFANSGQRIWTRNHLDYIFGLYDIRVSDACRAEGVAERTFGVRTFDWSSQPSTDTQLMTDMRLSLPPLIGRTSSRARKNHSLTHEVLSSTD